MAKEMDTHVGRTRLPSGELLEWCMREGRAPYAHVLSADGKDIPGRLEQPSDTGKTGASWALVVRALHHTAKNKNPDRHLAFAAKVANILKAQTKWKYSTYSSARTAGFFPRR